MKNMVTTAIGMSSIIKFKLGSAMSNHTAKKQLKKSAEMIDILVQGLLISEETIRSVCKLAGITEDKVLEMLAVIDRPGINVRRPESEVE